MAEINLQQKPKVSPLYDPVIRGYAAQALLVLVVGFLIYSAVNNAIENLQRAKIASGFGFWNNISGFPIGFKLIEYSEVMTYGRAFWVGLTNTLLVSILGVIIATFLGFAIGIGQLSKNWLVAKCCYWYVQIFRNIPLLLILFFFYNAVLKQLPGVRDSLVFGNGAFSLNNRGFYIPNPTAEPGFMLVPIALALGLILAFVFKSYAKRQQMATGKQYPVGLIMLGLIFGLPILTFIVTGFPLKWAFPEISGFNVRNGIQLPPEFLALLTGLSMYTAAFIAENVRAGIKSVSYGQSEASSALGLNRKQALDLVVVPQAMRVIIPPLTNQYLNLTKNSSLAVAIGYPDLVQVFAGTTLNQTGQAVEVLAITMLVYLTISLLTSFGMNWYNARKAIVER